jgi:serine/threonine protein kinase
MYEGRKLGNYVMYEQIGHGASADVYRGIHNQTKVDVAVKVINLSIISDEDEVCLIREVTTLLQIDHPNIVFTYEYIVDDSHLYIFSEYISGNMMLDKINEMRGLSEQLARKYFNDILSAVAYLHKSRLIVHRDIKLQNILISKNNSAKLIDFGFCNSLNFIKTFNSFVGTPGYTAPEIIDYAGHDCGCDIFSLGVCLYAMVVGKTPFDMQNNDANLLRAQIEEIKFPETLSPIIIDLIKKMLEPIPKKRASLDDVIKHPWVRMDRFQPEKFEYRKNTIDLGRATSVESLSEVKRKPQLILAKQAVRYLNGLGIDKKKMLNDVKRGIISPESAAYLIVVKNNIVNEDVVLTPIQVTTTRRPEMSPVPNISEHAPSTTNPRSRKPAKLPSLKVPRHGASSGAIPHTVPRLHTPTGVFSRRYRI